MKEAHCTSAHPLLVLFWFCRSVSHTETFYSIVSPSSFLVVKKRHCSVLELCLRHITATLNTLLIPNMFYTSNVAIVH